MLREVGKTCEVRDQAQRHACGVADTKTIDPPFASGRITPSPSPLAHAGSSYQAHDTAGYAFWLPGANRATPGTSYKWVQDSNPMLNFHDGNDWSDANDATLTGQIDATDFRRGSRNPSVWDVHRDFGPDYTYNQWIGMGGNVKVENNVPESVYKTWRFYELDSNGKAELTYVSGKGGHPKTLGLDFYDSDLIFQVGLRASMKNPNDVLGASAWIASTTRRDQFGHYCQPGHGDLNIELTPKAVPTPSASMAGLLGLGLLGGRPTQTTSLTPQRVNTRALILDTFPTLPRPTGWGFLCAPTKGRFISRTVSAEPSPFSTSVATKVEASSF